MQIREDEGSGDADSEDADLEEEDLATKDPILIVEGSAALPKTEQCAWNTLTGRTYRHLRNWGPVFLQSFGEPSIKEQ